MKRGLVLAAACIALLGAALLGWWSFGLVECRRADSPDGASRAVVACRKWHALVPAMPGSSGDQPGFVTVFTRAGRSCGTAPVPVAWMVDDFEWSATRAELPFVAEWDLVACSVRR